MNLVQVKTNIHDFERCERDVIIFILNYLTEKYTHRGRGGGGGFQHRHSIKKAKLREFKCQHFQGSVKFVSQNYTPVKFTCLVQTGQDIVNSTVQYI